MGASSNAETGFTGVYIGPDSELGVWKEATFYLKSRGDGGYRMSNMTIGLDSVDDSTRCKSDINDGKSTTVSIDDVVLYETDYTSNDMCGANIVPYIKAISDTEGTNAHAGALAGIINYHKDDGVVISQCFADETVTVKNGLIFKSNL